MLLNQQILILTDNIVCLIYNHFLTIFECIFLDSDTENSCFESSEIYV